MFRTLLEFKWGLTFGLFWGFNSKPLLLTFIVGRVDWIGLLLFLGWFGILWLLSGWIIEENWGTPSWTFLFIIYILLLPTIPWFIFIFCCVNWGFCKCCNCCCCWLIWCWCCWYYWCCRCVWGWDGDWINWGWVCCGELFLTKT